MSYPSFAACLRYLGQSTRRCVVHRGIVSFVSQVHICPFLDKIQRTVAPSPLQDCLFLNTLNTINDLPLVASKRGVENVLDRLLRSAFVSKNDVESDSKYRHIAVCPLSGLFREERGAERCVSCKPIG